ncbi:hypothetical protein Moror_4243 [Moniliophthora roreri MCA 2997]|uniref:F-box domain-containing protein n=2 Tax=Moniliophthora roreri TaxID=221103 RepID=V2XA52_MONRO|nr:hypothetical protein Moror_4243 [Moniliophthora roreri MCA 2997]KAI3602756.1 hypothetical protein WG66_008042 [Moniliophthora roreri]
MIPESPYSRNFGTNYAPSPQQIQEINQILREPEERLRALEEEIARLQAQRDNLQSFIDNHRSLLSPIRRVHSDILREIFVRCLPEDHLPVRSLREAPLLLTGICRSWREIAISTPRLWNRIHISLPHPRFPPITESFRSLVRSRAEGLALWLDRSGALPLTLSFHATMPSELLASVEGYRWRTGEQSLYDLQTLYVEFTLCLLPYSLRWGSVSFNIPYCIRELLERYEFGPLDRLKDFRSTLPARRARENARVHPFRGIFGRAHSLRVLHLDEAYFNLPIRWENLTELVLSSPMGGGRIFPSEAVRLLSLSCMSVRQCTIYIQLANHSTFDPPLTVVLPYLHTLNLHFNAFHDGHFAPMDIETSSSQVAYIFEATIAPSLAHLAINVASSVFLNYHFDPSPFISFIQRSGCVLSSFEPYLPVTVDGVIGLLRAMPFLSELKMHRGIFTAFQTETPPITTHFTDFVRALTPHSTDTAVLCPRLEGVTFVDCAHIEVEPLLALAEARCVPEHPDVRRLRRMLVSFNNFLENPSEVSSAIQSLRDRDMSVRWSSPPDHRGQLYNDSPLRGFVRARLDTFLSLDPMQSSSAHIY